VLRRACDLQKTKRAITLKQKKLEERKPEAEAVEFAVGAPFLIKNSRDEGEIVGCVVGVHPINSLENDPFFLLKYRDGRREWLYFNPEFWGWLWSSLNKKIEEKKWVKSNGE